MKPAIIFDMNGVLIDDEDLHREAFFHVARYFRMDMDDDDYFHFFAGRTDREGFHEYLTNRYRERLDEIERLLSEKAEAYRELAATKLKQYPGASVLVRRLSELGYDLAVATSSNATEADAVLTFLDIKRLLIKIVTADDVSKGKPSPEVFVKAARALRRNTGECIVIEDSPSGVSAAKAAGMRCIAVMSTHGEAELSGADLVCNSIDALTTESIDALT